MGAVPRDLSWSEDYVGGYPKITYGPLSSTWEDLTETYDSIVIGDHSAVPPVDDDGLERDLPALLPVENVTWEESMPILEDGDMDEMLIGYTFTGAGSLLVYDIRGSRSSSDSDTRLEPMREAFLCMPGEMLSHNAPLCPCNKLDSAASWESGCPWCQDHPDHEITTLLELTKLARRDWQIKYYCTVACRRVRRPFVEKLLTHVDTVHALTAKYLTFPKGKDWEPMGAAVTLALGMRVDYQSEHECSLCATRRAAAVEAHVVVDPLLERTGDYFELYRVLQVV
ncbi:uncharacterized protein VTP21DRAFT_2463 [Calcarisporiella thermophila]|uniref:uncharacterized protein n=1 Tax=Calcarisporiella thermophila TaxID=911321 RepID=UPI0037422866